MWPTLDRTWILIAAGYSFPSHNPSSPETRLLRSPVQETIFMFGIHGWPLVIMMRVKDQVRWHSIKPNKEKDGVDGWFKQTLHLNPGDSCSSHMWNWKVFPKISYYTRILPEILTWFILWWTVSISTNLKKIYIVTARIIITALAHKWPARLCVYYDVGNSRYCKHSLHPSMIYNCLSFVGS